MSYGADSPYIIVVQMRTRFRRASLLVIVTLVVMYAGLGGLRAATLVVTKLADADDGTCNADCSLREAIEGANAGDTVAFGADVRGTITLVLGELVVDRALTLLGPGQTALTISGGHTQRILAITPDGALTASGLTFAHGKGVFYAPLGVDAAGVVLNSGSFAFTDCTFVDNHADGQPHPGAVHDAAVAYSDGFGGTMSFTRCVFKDNTAGGGACMDIDAGTLTITDSTFIDNYGEFGPACIIANSADGSTTITGSTFTGNTARAGGALFLSGAFGTTIRNSTLTGNSSTAGPGAGIYVYGPVTVTLSNVTLSANSGTVGANLYMTNGGAAAARNTILAGTSSNCGGTGALASQGHNLDSGNTCALNAAGDKINTAPGLAPLGPSGGRTWTMALLANSAALDAGNGCEADDQRDVSRPQFSSCDIGAFESTGPETIGISGFKDPFNKHLYSWPAQAGVTQYQTRRSGSRTLAPPCVGVTTTGTSWNDTATPLAGAGFYYLNRPIAPRLGTWGWSAAGVERTTVCP